ncbi:hypothetical protein TKWG_16395 [Advenella kashmirensis WT001]|uniref:Uncharacterized protein n=1 Tax=Advenella kashmirensis (strain DSM 17095 / LMG 22695 / WT001) TaxID=1036672 RepID=I3UDZ0_ADVKW|nr:hypothetical protein TKWG_16395 [Advenella kashmirensis WT001]
MQVELLHSLADLPDFDWRAWSDDNPFISPAFLRAMENTGCTSEETGWQPCHLILYDQHRQPAGFMPMYLKTHSQANLSSIWPGREPSASTALNTIPNCYAPPRFRRLPAPA